jgi:superfamily II DNA or RNA helicase
MEVSLSVRCQYDFLPQDQRRGQSYFDGERVEIDRVSGNVLFASVLGSRGQTYRVSVNVARPEFEDPEFDCDCERFANGYSCKHVWAAILAWDADQRSDNSDAWRRNSQRDKRPAAWQKQLSILRRQIATEVDPLVSSIAGRVAGQPTRYWFAICLSDQPESDQPESTSLKLRLFQSQPKVNGEWSKPQQRAVQQDELEKLIDPEEREIFSLLRPVNDDEYAPYRFSASWCRGNSTFTVPVALQNRAFTLLAETGRFVWMLGDARYLEDAKSLTWDDGPPWSLTAELRSISEQGVSHQGVLDKEALEEETLKVGAPNGEQPPLELASGITRGGETRELDDIVLAFSDGLVMFQDGIARLRPADAPWISACQQSGPVQFPEAHLDAFLAELSQLPHVPDLSFAKDLGIETVRGAPQPKLIVQRSEQPGLKRSHLPVDIVMKYSDQEIGAETDRRAFWDPDQRKWHLRNPAAEEQLFKAIAEFPFSESRHYQGSDLSIDRKWLPKMVPQLVAAGWEVVAHGRVMRSANSFDIKVSSSTDWFDLAAEVDFGGVKASLPALLSAIKQKSPFVALDDGSQGMLPTEWLERYAPLAKMGTVDGEVVRFSKTQALLLDVMLAEQESVVVDRDFAKYCQKLESFNGVKPGKEPRGFQGELRPYQRDGLGWFEFLREFGFGGCLADDMGLGKTIQVLAMLEARRTKRLKQDQPQRPSIVVVPKSLVFNWIEEAARFTPRLKVLNYTGLDRSEQLEKLGGGDLFVTTYGTLRRDIAKLKDVAFDYAILDEAQAIKNANSQSAKACRLLQAEFRLAMTGTPVENHLGELWSLFDFLNPGMLGRSAAFRNLTSNQNGDTKSLAWLGRTLRPFILRRTKQQVLKELPTKTEQTLYCEMKPKQRTLYAELREHYQAHIGRKVDELGIGRSKIHVLEALLRLRQAACDPRLIDKQQKAEGAKIELLLKQLGEVIAEGHKALVFSQFTSLLALVRSELDQREWPYEYLDGKTQKRAERVKHFQSDDACKLFLISLKAGGQGLNLTAADYVFILDPWWNPAVEAQAIDRAHRIGQSRPVMAYRIICRDSVEDKILQLQQSKRDLADAIISANESLISKLSVEDLQMLFS